jgi:microcystin degradation protein MlrC
LLAHRAFNTREQTAVVASITDPAAVATCFASGLEREVTVLLGGKLDALHAEPLEVTGVVANLVSDDPVGGAIAVLRARGVHVIITSRRKPFHRVRDFTDLSLNPTEHDVLAVKIGYLEPELRAIARLALLALTPGSVNQDIKSLTYKRVLRPIYPLDEDMPDPDLTPSTFGRARG